MSRFTRKLTTYIEKATWVVIALCVVFFTSYIYYYGVINQGLETDVNISTEKVIYTKYDSYYDWVIGKKTVQVKTFHEMGWPTRYDTAKAEGDSGDVQPIMKRPVD